MPGAVAPLEQVTPVDPLAFTVLTEISIISQIAGNLLERVLPGEMKLSQFVVLNHFVRLGGERTPNELARAFQVTKGAMTNTIQRLEARGLIRITQDAKDQRVKRITLTDAGREARAEAVAASAPMLAQLTEALSLQDLAAILPVLARLRTWVGIQRNDWDS